MPDLAAELQAAFRRWAGVELGGAYLPETWQAVAARATELLKPGAQLQALRKRKSGGRNGGRPRNRQRFGTDHGSSTS